MIASVETRISSPSYANFAFRKTENQENRFAKEVAQTLIRNLYVDALPKSSKDVPTAVQHVKDVTKMCESGGFRLTKFTSNSRKVLASIPKEERAKNV